MTVLVITLWGLGYELGMGVPINFQTALYWYQKAADTGDEYGKKNLEILLAKMSNNNQEEVSGKEDNTESMQEELNNLDVKIPDTNRAADNTFAIIIGNENYQNAVDVPFAGNDAKIFASYCEKTLGLPTRNIKTYNNATYGMIVNAITRIKDTAKAYNGKLNVIFYYSGHGIPNEETHEAFLLPTDADGRNTDICYSLNKLYRELGNLKAERVLVFLDACFSGAVKGNGMVVQARGVAVKPKMSTISGNMVVLSAASGTETAYPYNDAKHGMFTYFLLNKIRKTKGNITLGALSDYINSEVRKSSMLINDKIQTPTCIVSSNLSSSWKGLGLCTK